MNKNIADKVDAYYINMPEDEGRSRLIETQWQDISIKLMRHEAVDAKKLDVDACSRYNPYRWGNPCWSLTPLEVAIFKSHRQIWHEIVRADKKYAIVMEDDIIITADFENLIANTIEVMDNKVDLVRLSRSNERRAYGKKIELQNSFLLRQIIQTTCDAGCYLVSRQGARQLIHQSQLFCEPLDCYLFIAKGLRIYQAFPAVAEQLIYKRHGKEIMSKEIIKKLPNFQISHREEQHWWGVRRGKGPLLFKILREMRKCKDNIYTIIYRIKGAKYGKVLISAEMMSNDKQKK